MTVTEISLHEVQDLRARIVPLKGGYPWLCLRAGVFGPDFPGGVYDHKSGAEFSVCPADRAAAQRIARALLSIAADYAEACGVEAVCAERPNGVAVGA